MDGARRGFVLQDMQAFTPEGGPWGTAWAEVLNRTEGVTQASAAEKQYQRQPTPIEAKERRRWLTGLRQARPLAQELPGVHGAGLGDSEADIDELCAEPRGVPSLPWLIRAYQDRALATGVGPHRREQVLASRLLYQIDRLIRGRQAKTAVEVRARRQNRATRRAQVGVRAATVTLRPLWRCDRELPPVTVNVVLVHEPNPPADDWWVTTRATPQAL